MIKVLVGLMSSYFYLRAGKSYMSSMGLYQINMSYDKTLIEFMNYLEDRFTEESNSRDRFPDKYSIRMVKGRRFDKIVHDNKYDFNRIHCFVERDTGNIYKPDPRSSRLS